MAARIITNCGCREIPIRNNVAFVAIHDASVIVFVAIESFLIDTGVNINFGC